MPSRGCRVGCAGHGPPADSSKVAWAYGTSTWADYTTRSWGTSKVVAHSSSPSSPAREREPGPMLRKSLYRAGDAPARCAVGGVVVTVDTSGGAVFLADGVDVLIMTGDEEALEPRAAP
ncbi:MAG TPA: hypothetical protein VG253_24695 [Streptosporangiaceae bacterium]|nr:hypothetical protein [Streptosporangiaceae bacterium]